MPPTPPTAKVSRSLFIYLILRPLCGLADLVADLASDALLKVSNLKILPETTPKGLAARLVGVTSIKELAEKLISGSKEEQEQHMRYFERSVAGLKPRADDLLDVDDTTVFPL